MAVNRGFVKIDAPEKEIPDFDTFTVMGDPGCDGLGAEIMNTFARALKATNPAFAVILGDIVPIAKREVYEIVNQFAGIVADYPLYALCGNHDTAFFDEFYGLRDYVLYNDRTAFIALDDSKRSFSDTTLMFLEQSLKKFNRENVVVMFHIPPPNRFSGNTISADEWAKARKVLDGFPGKVSFILCGHVHTFFEDNLDGIRLVVSAGAGARLEQVFGPVDKMKAYHHVLKFSYGSQGKLNYEHITLDGVYYGHEIADAGLREMLQKDLSAKSQMYLTATLYARDAAEKGLENTAKFFRMVADSAFYHARNHLHNLNLMRTAGENVAALAQAKDRDLQGLYKGNIRYAEQKNFGLARYSFIDTEQAEKTQLAYFAEVSASLDQGKDIKPSKYYTCSSCGNTVIGDEPPLNCPLCGAPRDKLFEVA